MGNTVPSGALTARQAQVPTNAERRGTIVMATKNRFEQVDDVQDDAITLSLYKGENEALGKVTMPAVCQQRTVGERQSQRGSAQCRCLSFRHQTGQYRKASRRRHRSGESLAGRVGRALPSGGLTPSLRRRRFQNAYDGWPSSFLLGSRRFSKGSLALRENFLMYPAKRVRALHLAQIHIPELSFTIWERFAGVNLQAGGQPHVVLIGRTFLRHVTLHYEGATGKVTITH